MWVLGVGGWMGGWVDSWVEAARLCEQEAWACGVERVSEEVK